MGGILMSMGNFPESLNQAILAGRFSVGRLGVSRPSLYLWICCFSAPAYLHYTCYNMKHVINSHTHTYVFVGLRVFSHMHTYIRISGGLRWFIDCMGGSQLVDIVFVLLFYNMYIYIYRERERYTYVCIHIYIYIHTYIYTHTNT